MLLALKWKYFFILDYKFDFIFIFNALKMRMYVVFCVNSFNCVPYFLVFHVLWFYDLTGLCGLKVACLRRNVCILPK